MNPRWETSDSSYDLRASSTPERLNDHLEELADKPVTCVDNDYLSFLRLLTGQFAEPQTAFSSTNPDPPEGDHNLCEDQRPKTGTTNDLPNDEIQKKRNPDTEIDREYAIFVANTRSLERCINGNGKRDQNFEGDRDISPRSLEGGATHDNTVQNNAQMGSFKP